MAGWVVVTAAVAYIALLFGVASYGDRVARSSRWRRARPFIYALSLTVYCTSWTFFGSVGLAAANGLDFLPVYVGPAMMLLLGLPLVRRIVRLAKAQNITSVADFVAARYGKSQPVAAIVTIIAVVGAVPYIALQLKAISASVATMAGYLFQTSMPDAPILFDSALLIAVALAVFAILFGTRHIDATEHQHGLMLAIAVESIVKLGAFLAVGLFVTFGMYGGPGELWSAAREAGSIVPQFFDIHGEAWITITLLSFGAIVLLPRQFHVMVVENNSERELGWARWLFPAYLVLINLFVVPIAAAGLHTFGRAGAVPDMYVLSLPMSAGANAVSLIAFIGGLSAATAMVIVASVAVSIMVCNDLVMPFLLRRHDLRGASPHDMGKTLLFVRRTAIFAILLLAYAYYRTAGNSAALASIGLMSFAAVAQLAPAFFGGIFWERATARGAIGGTVAGFLAWIYTLLLPTFAQAGLLPSSVVTDGPFGIMALRPQDLFFLGLEPLTNGVLWSLLVNVTAFVALSLTRRPHSIERLQANVFVKSELAPLPHAHALWRSEATVGELTSLIARYLGQERTERSLESFAAESGLPLDPDAEIDLRLLRYSEHLLASAIGAPSSRLVLALLLGRHGMSSKQALRLLDDASEAIVHNRDLLQSAIDHVDQGIVVLDTELRLSCWNRRFRDLLNVPAELGRVGVPLRDILRFLAERGDFGEGPVQELVEDRMRRVRSCRKVYHERLAASGLVLETHSTALPDGGFVTTYTDITERVRTAEELARSNETLERRVRERTEELVRLNRELDGARATAEAANLGKTRFMAAASHDILQPLNAARLYASTLTERHMAEEDKTLAANVDASLDAVEEILGAILDISRLDTGALRPEFGPFRIGELLQQLRIEFEPLAAEQDLRLRVVDCSAIVRSDRRLLRRLLRNLVSNALKYTPAGGTVLLGCRRTGGALRAEVHDTGAGIPADKQTVIFEEFQRLEDGARRARGVGLGLSIVERVGRVLQHHVGLRSTVGRGSVFSVDLPLATEQSAPADLPAAPAPTGPLGALTALCIDNEPRILEGMRALLAGWGCQAICVATAEAALAEVAAKGPPDIVLADYHLDTGTGIEAVARLREAAGTELPAALITADRTPEVRAAAQAAGIAVLFKPVKAASLRALLAQHARLREAAE